jgi:hypothetical protein
MLTITNMLTSQEEVPLNNNRKSNRLLYNINAEKKYNWCMSSGNSIQGVHTVDILENKTKKEVGSYIKLHVRDLFEHFIHLTYCDDSGGKVWTFMWNLYKKYSENLNTCEDKEHFEQVIMKIEKELSKIEDENIVDEFMGYDTSYNFVTIRTLPKRKRDLEV